MCRQVQRVTACYCTASHTPTWPGIGGQRRQHGTQLVSLAQGEPSLSTRSAPPEQCQPSEKLMPRPLVSFHMFHNPCRTPTRTKLWPGNGAVSQAEENLGILFHTFYRLSTGGHHTRKAGRNMHSIRKDPYDCIWVVFSHFAMIFIDPQTK